jgi:hypothetical protein
MRSLTRWWIVPAATALVLAGACTSNTLDDADSANVVLQVENLENPVVTGNVQLGVCANSGAQCLDTDDCDPNDPADDCVIDPSGTECQISEWNATLANEPKTALAVDSPFSDIVLQDVTLEYTWHNGFVMSGGNSRVIPLSGTIQPNTTQQVGFLPISAEDLTDLRAAFPAQERSANVQMTFRGRVEDGEAVTVTAGGQLFVEACN